MFSCHLVIEDDQQNPTPVPYKEVWVERGKRFRLRFVGGLCTVCGVQISIEGHGMTLIATDGTPVKAVSVRSIDIFAGNKCVLATGAKGWGFEPGQGNGFLRAIKIRSTPSSRMGSKAGRFHVLRFYSM
jgi:FtsP/CotA-like multicopper oxidase with cupredoxin domain